MKNKFTLTGTDNDGFRHRYSVKKNEGFKRAFVKFMVDLEFDEKKIKASWDAGFYDENDEWVPRVLKIAEIEDVCWHYQNKKYDVDVFYGRFKIIIVVRTKGRVSMVKHLENKAEWIKPLEIKKIQKEKASKKEMIVPLRKGRDLK